jgi:hypothetical protein
LTVRAGESRDVPDEDAGIRIALDDGGVSAHTRGTYVPASRSAS